VPPAHGHRSDVPLLPAQPDTWTAAIFVDELNLHPRRILSAIF
jgi:hypothetical protein